MNEYKEVGDPGASVNSGPVGSTQWDSWQRR